MATINASLPTLQDIMSRTMPDGSIESNIVELLSQNNAVLADAVWVEGNLPTGHKFTSRTALPSGTWRRFNEGVAPTKSRTDQVTESCGALEALSKVDEDEAKLNGNAAAFRASEDKGFQMGLSNDLETAFFYSSTLTDPEKIMGFSPRLNSTSGLYGGQIIDSQIAAAGGDQSSMWFVNWSPNTVHAIYPKGSKGGLSMTDLGRQLTRDGGGTNEFVALVSKWRWEVGLCVRDARYLCRLANIDTSAIAETGSLLIQDMVKAYHQVKDWTMGRGAIYCNRKISTYLHLQALDSTKNSTLKIENIGGQPVTTFLGIPIRMSDALLNTEAIIT